MNKTKVRNHVLVWVLYWLASYISFSNNYQDTPLTRFIVDALLETVIFYICVYKLISPNFPQKYLKTIGQIVGFLFLVSILKLFILDFIHPQVSDKDTAYKLGYTIGANIRSHIIIVFFAFLYWFYIKAVKEEKMRRRAEVNFLKAQINPHFLFNTLNFVYNDISKLSPKSGEAIMALTRMMRYSVESTKADLITLSKELEAIQEYLDLQQLRFGEKLALNYTKTGSFGFMAFPPLVLVSLIENAFKYGVHDDPDNPIDIKLNITSQGLHFTCKNKKRLDFSDKETTSVGITNINRRLEMAYANGFTLFTNDNNSHYEVVLDVKWI